MLNQTRDLFIVQNDLIETKIEVSVSKAINQVVEQIVNLRMEMHQEIGGLRQEMHQEIGGLRQEMHVIGERLSAVEATLGMRNKTRDEIRNRFYDYSFKAGWLILGSLLTYAIIHFNMFLR